MAEDTYSYRHRVAHELVVLRQSANLSRKDVCAQTGWSGAKLSRLESGVRMPITANVLLLCHLYGATQKMRDDLMLLVGQGRVMPACEAFADILSEAEMEYFERLLTTQNVSEFSGGVIPHTLRTETYSARLRQHEIPELNLERFAEFDAFVRQPRPGNSQTYIINESALCRVVGGPDAWREQLKHLATMERQFGMTVLVIPFSAGPIGGLDTPFALIDSDVDTRVGIIHLPYHDPIFQREESEVTRLQQHFNFLGGYTVPLRTMMPQALARLA